ncbi:DEAD/DEAH box helicase [Pararhodospirillum oryzae]|uniref:Uncharacterized protein n=1 Tax=Pararhodospirillum oryzae TaxID=478448 RepID=A0A512H7H8_9PROT|nr:DEAD/DEAH box helicase [Pararhodospirillum oryzae]GEO81413.1 hypothetical protein ROR02_15440 [Pararhodospirillum oryzae]
MLSSPSPSITPSALPADQRLFLGIRAALGGPLPRTAMERVLKAGAVPLPGISAEAFQALGNTLIEKRLLGKKGFCSPTLAHVMTRDLLASLGPGRFKSLVEKACPLLPFQPDRPNPPLRLAVYLNDRAFYENTLERQASFYKASHLTETWDLEKAFGDLEVDGPWLATLDSFFWPRLVAARAARVAAWGQNPGERDRLAALMRDHPALAPACWPFQADLALLNADLPALDALLAAVPAGVPPSLVLAPQGARALLAGEEPARAVALFGAALKEHRKITRKRKGGLPGLAGVLHACALLAAATPDSLNALAVVLPDKDPSPDALALRALHDLALNHLAEARNRLHALPPPRKEARPLPVALTALALAHVNPADLKHGEDGFQARFTEMGTRFPLAARILAEALAPNATASRPYTAFLEKTLPALPFRFMDVIATKAPWERVLANLEAVLAPAAAPPTSTAAPGARRLAWMIDMEHHNIAPVEQVLQARGWSAGRPVALQRFQREDPRLDYLDSHDRKALDTLSQRIDAWSYAPVWEFPPHDTLPALIGHPRVFDAHAPTHPVELVAGRVELILAACKSGYSLTVSHGANSPAVFLDRESPTRWHVVELTAQGVALGALLGPTGLQVPPEGREHLIRIAQLEAPSFPLRIEAEDLDDTPITPGSPASVLRLEPLDEGLRITQGVRPAGAEGPFLPPGVGTRILVVGGGENRQRVRRDPEAESRAAAALRDACPMLDGEGPAWILDDLGSALELLHALQALPEPPALEWPRGETLRLLPPVSGRAVQVSIHSGTNWFAVEGSVQVDEGLVLDLKDVLDRLGSAPRGFVPLGEGRFLALEHSLRTRLAHLNRLGDLERLPTLAGAIVRDLLDDAGQVQGDAGWRAFVERLDNARDWTPALPAGFTAELRDYQRDGFAWMARLARWGAGALLADDMGLGKTIQTLAVMVDKARHGPVLVVAPVSVCGNWAAEIARFAPGLAVTRLAEAEDRGEVLDALEPGRVLIVSYGLLPREEERLRPIRWAMLVLDEAQAIKNPDTQRARTALALTADFRVALTGTPIENSLDELWSLFRFLNPGLLGGRSAFTQRFAGPQAQADPTARAALRALVRPFLLRRTKASVLAELPPRTEQTLVVEPGPDERAFYEALRRTALERLDQAGEARTRVHILAEITRLRQACCDPALVAPEADVPSAKREAFLDLIAELREGRHRALVFSQFVGHLNRIKSALDAAAIPYLSLDGSTPSRERDRRVAAFQAGEGDVFLISLKAGGVGLNLTAADYVIHLDPWWNPAVEDQASDRAHRLGQQRPVTIYRLVIKNSIEEGILALHQRKRDLADALLEDADHAGTLSEEELLGLIQAGL